MGFHVTGQWAGKDKLQCDDCSYDTVRPDLMDAHLQTAHVRRVRRSGVLGPDGSALVVEEAQDATEAPQDGVETDDDPDIERGREYAAEVEAPPSYGRLLAPSTWGKANARTRDRSDDGDPDPNNGREADPTPERGTER